MYALRPCLSDAGDSFCFLIMIYEKRIYRQDMKASDLDYFQVTELETDLYIGVDHQVTITDLKKLIIAEVKNQRKNILDHEKNNPGFIYSLIPIRDNKKNTPIVKDMIMAALQTGIGPMGAVAGAMVKQVGKLISSYSQEIIIENGGDIFIHSMKTRRISLYTRNNYFKNLGLKIKPTQRSLGICTSSGTMGHSLSFGKADSVTIISENPALADACATALGNRIKEAKDIENGLNWIKNISGILGALVIIDDKLGAWGEIELC